MAGIGDLFIEIGSKFNSEGITSAEQAISNLGKKTTDVKSISDRFVITMGDVVNGAKWVASQLWSVAEAAGENELAVRRLADSMKAQGIYTDEALEANKAYALTLQNSTKYNDEAVMSAMQLLTTFGLHDKQLRTTTEAVANLASGMGIGLDSAAMLVGKAFAGNTQMLSRYGITVDQSIPKSQQFEAVMRQLQTRFKGMAEGEATTFVGKVEQLKNQFDELKESVGAPLLTPLKNLIQTFIDGAKTGQEFLDVLKGFSKTMDTTESKTTVANAGFKSLTAGIKSYVGDIATVGQYLADNFSKGFKEIEKLDKKKNDNIVKDAKATAKEIKTVSTGETNNEKLAADERLKIRKAELEGRKRAEGIMSAEITAMRTKEDTIMSMSFSKAMNDMLISYQSFGSMFQTFWSEIHGTVKDSFIELITNIQDGWSSFSEFAGKIWDGMKKAFINVIAEMATRWLMQHVIMKGITLAWKAIEIAAAAAVGAARAAAASAWTLWGAIAIGASIGLAIMAMTNQFADGVRDFKGGVALVGERGPELVSLPRGSNVYSNQETQGMLNNAGGGGVTVNGGPITVSIGSVDKSTDIKQLCKQIKQAVKQGNIEALEMVKVISKEGNSRAQEAS